MPRTLSEADGRKLAFRCKSCGRLHESDHAGEAPHPHACSVCGKGVAFAHQGMAEQAKEAVKAGQTEKALQILEDMKRLQPGLKTLVPDNWEVLADVSQERLKELGLESHHVVAHKPWTKPSNSPQREPQHLERSATEGVATSEKVG